MKKFPIGIIINSFRTDIPTSVRKAAECGAQGIQVYSTHGEMAPENLSPEKRREFLNLVKDNGLIISALCGDLGGHGFEIAKDNAERIEKTKAIVDLAVKFGTNVVTTHIGVVPKDKTSDKYKIMQEAYDKIIRISHKKRLYMKKAGKIPKITFKSTKQMGYDYLDVYNDYLNY